MDLENAERKELARKRRAVGFLFALAVLVSMVFAYWMGAFGMGPTAKLYVTYDFAGGLEAGSVVRLAGVKVGRVTSIDFVEREDSTGEANGETANKPAGGSLKLKLEVSKSALKQIREGTQFYINLSGLIGERYVEVVPGTGAPVANGHTFRGEDPPRIDQLFSQGYGIFGDLRGFFNENKGDLQEILGSMNELARSVQKILSSVSPEQRRQLTVLLGNLAAMSGDLREVSSALRSTSDHLKEKNIERSFAHLQSLLRKGDEISIQDLRKLILEDGVKVNFSSRKVEIPRSAEKE